MLQSRRMPQCLKSLPELPNGERLLSAIDACQIFEKDNPKWFNKTYGALISNVNPKMQSQISQSGDSSYGSMSCWSDHYEYHQNYDSNTADSPDSVFDSFDFSKQTPHNNKKLPGQDISTHVLCDERSIETSLYMPTLSSYSEEKPRLMSSHINVVPTPSEFGVRSFVTVASELDDQSSPSFVDMKVVAYGPATKACDQSNQDEGRSGTQFDQSGSNVFNKNCEHQECSSPVPPDTNHDLHKFDIKPPSGVSDMTSDCLSLAFRQVNHQDKFEEEENSLDPTCINEDKQNPETTSEVSEKYSFISV